MNSNINILIAEDEENIALALKTIVAKAIIGANITIVTNGKEALDSTFEKDYKLIVSDWNMPEMTGIELLTELRNSESTRDIPFLMLTARGDKPSVVSALQGGVTSYLTKPFEKQNVIDRIQSLLDIANTTEEVPEEEITVESLSIKLHSGDIEFPIFPAVGMKAVELTKSESVTMEELSTLIQQDTALTSKLLLIANSPHYRGTRKFENIEDSLMRIGLRDTSNLILAISNKSLYKDFPGIIGKRLEALWEHSFATGTCARIIARKLDLMYPDRMFAMGLLHDIGKLTLLTVVGALSKNRDTSEEALDELLNGLHVEFGKSLVNSWDMPGEFVSAVENHHNLNDMDNLPASTRVVAMANLLVRRLGKSLIPDDGTDLTKTNLAKLLWLSDEMIDDILAKTEEYVEAHRNSF